MTRFACTVITMAALCSTGLLFHSAPERDDAPWVLGPLSPSLRTLFSETVPSLSTEDSDTHRDHDRLQLVLTSISQETRSIPAFQDVVDGCARQLDDPRTTRSDLLRTGVAMNAALRDLQIPVFVDVDARGGWDHRLRRNVWMLRVRTYVIERAHTFVVDGAPHPTLWIERLDERDDEEGAIGIKKGGMPYSLILLHQLRRQWYETVLPTITSHAEEANARALYRHHQTALRIEMLTALKTIPSDGERAADTVLSRMLMCMEPTLELPNPAEMECPDTVAEMESAAVELMGRVVERHELHHASRTVSSRVLDGEWPTVDADIARTATSEVAATLAEMARGETPRMSLVQALSVPRWRRRTADGLAATALGHALMRVEPGVDGVDALIELPIDMLRMRAARAYHALFGMPVPLL